MPITESPDYYNFTGASPSREYERLNRNKQLDRMNEPKSDTPRTDMKAGDGWSEAAICVSVSFARTLERELNEAKAVINQLPDGAIETLQKWFTAKTERDAWRACAERLVRCLKNRNDDSRSAAIDRDDVYREFNKLKASQ